MDVCQCTLDPQDATVEKVASTYMAGAWANHGYRMSPDGSTFVLPTSEGFEVRKGGASWKHAFDNFMMVDRELFWSPDSKKFVFHLPDDKLSIGLVDLNDPGDPVSGGKSKTLYSPPKGAGVRGIEWSPRGDEVFLLEHFRVESEDGTKPADEGERIRAVSVPGGTAREVFSTRGTINFFMPPVSRFQSGGGASPRPFSIVLGLSTGLATVSPDGKEVVTLSETPCVGLTNLEWSPSPEKEKIVLFFRSPTKGKKRTFKGVFLVHLDKRKPGQAPAEADESIFEQLTPSLDVHTLWFSPKGKYVAWASQDAVWFREPDAPAESVVKIDPKDEKGLALEVKGCAWDASEKLLAVAAGNRLYVHDVASKKTRLVRTFEGEGGFAAEPSWRGERVVLTVFSAVSKKNAKDR